MGLVVNPPNKHSLRAHVKQTTKKCRVVIKGELDLRLKYKELEPNFKAKLCNQSS